MRCRVFYISDGAFDNLRYKINNKCSKTLFFDMCFL